TGEQLRNEKSPEIVDACIRALASAMDITRQGYESVRPGAFQQITSGIGERAKRLGGGPDDAAMLIPMIRAAQIARDALSLQDVRLQLSDQSVRQAAELGGHLLAYAVRGVQAKAFAQDDSQLRDQVATVIQLAESTIILAAQRARIAQPPLN